MRYSFVYSLLIVASVVALEDGSRNDGQSRSASGTKLVVLNEIVPAYNVEAAISDTLYVPSDEQKADKSKPISAEYIPEERPHRATDRKRGKVVASGDCTFVPPTVSPCLVQQVIPVQQFVQSPQQPIAQGGRSTFGCQSPCRPRPACRPRCSSCNPRSPCRSKPRPTSVTPPPPSPPTTTSQFTEEELHEREEIQKFNRKEYHAKEAANPEKLFELLHPHGSGEDSGKEQVCKCKARFEQTTTAAPIPDAPPAANPNPQPQQNSYGQPTSYGQGSMPSSGVQRVSRGYGDGYEVSPVIVPVPANYDNSANFANVNGNGVSNTPEEVSTHEAVCDFFIIEYPNEYIFLSEAVRKQLKSIWKGYSAGSASCPKQEEETKKFLDGLTGKDKEEVSCITACYPDHSKKSAGAAHAAETE